MKKFGMALGLTTVVLALAFAPAAGATSSSVDAYGGDGGVVAGIAGGGSPGDPGASGDQVVSSSLPFTGLDVSLLVGGGVLLLVLGVGMAKLTSRDPVRGA